MVVLPREGQERPGREAVESSESENPTSLHMMFYTTISKPYPRTPAMAAGIADHIWTCEEIAVLLD